ncbi:MAG: inorganic phosphate transporter [Bacteroidales bacterium]|jgi:PiT family inorganic phosphate transporter
MFGLTTGLTLLLLMCLLAACTFEFINGFHDTANAVATVIYTNSLKPRIAVIWSGTWNFIGVYFGGIAVAMAIVNLLPVEALVDNDMSHSIAMIMALIFSAIIWNIGTWYFGIPISSSHTLIGSIFGVGLAYRFLPGSTATALNWHKVQEIGLSLLISPFFGFFLALLVMYILFKTIRKRNRKLFKTPPTGKAPPLWVRAVMVIACTGVSFSHGSNDGQKGVGLIMLILIGVVPGYFAIDRGKSPVTMHNSIVQVDNAIRSIDTSKITLEQYQAMKVIRGKADTIEMTVSHITSFDQIPQEKHFLLRKNILILARNIDFLLKSLSDSNNKGLLQKDLILLKKNVAGLKTNTEYAPWWVILMVSLSLGMGTMIGWKRIVVTVGERIGKTPLNYAQGATSQIIAACTIGASSMFGLPVSTTHVLSSGVAGTMVAQKGFKNLQGKTIKNIALSWIVTLPVTIVLSGSIFLFLRWLL